MSIGGTPDNFNIGIPGNVGSPEAVSSNGQQSIYVINLDDPVSSDKLTLTEGTPSTETKGGYVITSMLNFAGNFGVLISADKAGTKTGKLLNRLFGSTEIKESTDKGIEEKIGKTAEANPEQATTEAPVAKGRLETLMKDSREILDKASPTELLGRVIVGTGLALFVASTVAVHIAGPLAGIFLAKLATPVILPIAIVCTFITAVLHAPLLGDPIALKLGLDPKKTNAAVTVALGVAGALLIATGAAIGSIPVTELIILDTGSKVTVTVGMFATLMLTSAMIEFGRGIAEEGKSEAIPNMCYKDDIAQGIQNACDAIDKAPGLLAKRIYDFGVRRLSKPEISPEPEKL